MSSSKSSQSLSTRVPCELEDTNLVEVCGSISGVYIRCSGVYIRGVYIKGVHIRGVSCHLSMKGVFSVSTRSVVEEAHNVWHEVTDSQRVRHDIVDSDLNMDQVERNYVEI